jgi:hypothetical protein
MYVYSSTSTNELVVAAFIDVRKPTPSANVIDQDAIKSGASALHVPYELLKAFAPGYANAASAIRIGAHDHDISSSRIGSDCRRLVLHRVFLLIGGHAQILRCAQAGSSLFLLSPDLVLHR